MMEELALRQKCLSCYYDPRKYDSEPSIIAGRLLVSFGTSLVFELTRKKRTITNFNLVFKPM